MVYFSEVFQLTRHIVGYDWGFCNYRGWSGGAMVLCKLPVPGGVGGWCDGPELTSSAGALYNLDDSRGKGLLRLQ